jgi:alcohol dehydrogenase class IV
MDFDFATVGRLVFGAGRAAELPTVLAELGSRALVCTGAHPGRHAKLLSSLTLPQVVSTVDGEPTVDQARTVTAAAREHGADIVVGIGGGSVLDLAKTVAMLLSNGGDPLDYMEVVGRGRPITRPSVPFVAVPTTAGTGSEVTANAVLIAPDERRLADPAQAPAHEHAAKASVRSLLMLARVALVDPLLTVDCPPAVTASSGLDALTQCLEPLVSVRANPLTDGLAREGLRRAGSGLRRAYADGADVAARTDMAACAVSGGIALANAKLGAVHGFAGVLGALAGVPHGMACAAFLVPVVEANLRALHDRQPDSPAVERYAEAARLLTGDPTATTADGLDWLRETVAQLRVPPVALDPAQAAGVVQRVARASSTRGNPVELTGDELHAILVKGTGSPAA